MLWNNKWNNKFTSQSGRYSIHADIAVPSPTDSVALNFAVRKMQTNQRWNITLRLNGEDAVLIKSTHEPVEWIWKQGFELINRSAESGLLETGEYLLSPGHLESSSTLNNMVKLG